MTDYTIENIGGIERAELHLAPGVNVLRGRNGVGKSTAIRAITRASGGDAEIERRDGAKRGTVEGPSGTLLRVGQVVTRPKDSVVELSLATTAPLDRLIDPGIADSDKAARARIRALVSLLGLGVTDATVATLTQGEVKLGGWLRNLTAGEDLTLLEASEKLRHYAHALARVHEQDAEEAEGRSKAARERAEEALDAVGGEGGLVSLTVEEAREALLAGRGAYERDVARCEAREELERRQAEIRETLGDRPEVGLAQDALVDALAELQNVSEAVRVLEQRLADAKARLRTAQAGVGRSRIGVADAEAAQERWDAQKAILDRKPDGPTREELVALEAERVDAFVGRLEVAEVSARFRDAARERTEADAVRASESDAALRLRAFADALPERLGQILERAGAKSLRVVDGRLAATLGGEFLDYERRLSDGQRVRVALDVAAEVYRGQVVPLSGDYWSRLDPKAREEFASLAAARALRVITEEPADGEMRVEHLPA